MFFATSECVLGVAAAPASLDSRYNTRRVSFGARQHSTLNQPSHDIAR